MITFLIGLIVGWSMGMYALSSYKRTLQMTAETTHSEYINGKWYVIWPERKAK